MVTSLSLVPLQIHSVTSKANLCFSQSNIDTISYHSVCKMRLLVFLCLNPSLSQPLSSSFPSVLSCFSPVWLFVTLWTVAHQALLSIGFFRQEYWSGLPFPSPGDLCNPGIKRLSLTSPALAGGFFPTSTTWEPILDFIAENEYNYTLFYKCSQSSKVFYNLIQKVESQRSAFALWATNVVPAITFLSPWLQSDDPCQWSTFLASYLDGSSMTMPINWALSMISVIINSLVF